MTDTLSKQALRNRLRKIRKAEATALPENVRALVLRRPPSPLLELVPEGAAIGLYRATRYEAPANGYARFFAEAGHTIALPRMGDDGAMHFVVHTDPFGEADLVDGPHAIRQPGPEAPALTPQIVFVPLLGFTERGERLGQGGGHYDRWLGDHPDAIPIGIGWDGQLVEHLPLEPHDRSMQAVVTPTRLYGPFA